MTSVAGGTPPGVRPLNADIDVFGLTHPGLVRPNNEDQFLIASLHKTMRVHSTSVPVDRLSGLTSESRGHLFVVADGVGGRPGGEHASGTALQAIAAYATNTLRLYYQHDPAPEGPFLSDLEAAVSEGHAAVLAEAAGTATTLTMILVRWPRAYLVHVGDSRCYRLREGKLEQMTKDQTMAQALVDAGVLPPDQVSESRWANVLSSALGAQEMRPAITSFDCRWEDVVMLCTDGLTKHVADDEIATQLRETRSAEQICRNLIELALARGGSDNVTVVAGRLKERTLA
ncbi:MAG TPA: protein phosphatase 2C domain-containing protein [Gemmatimonadales bacterium]|nr:protein phosphatase 2C domain-containing protein [Gemmatimonadales bacterium]